MVRASFIFHGSNEKRVIIVEIFIWIMLKPHYDCISIFRHRHVLTLGASSVAGPDKQPSPGSTTLYFPRSESAKSLPER